MSKRIFALLTLLVIASMLLVACGTKATEEPMEDEWGNIVFAAGDVVKIGMSSALTDAYAVYGQDMLNAVELAISDFGDLKGWELTVEGGDDQCDGPAGVTVAELFAADPTVIGVIGPMCSDSVVPASKIYSEHNMVMISPSSTAVIVTARGFESIFRTVANDDLQAEVTVGFLMEDLGLSKLAVAHDQSVYGEGVAQAVSDKFEAGGGTVTAFEGITRGDVDFSAVISVLLEGDPEAIYWGGMDAEGALLITQLRAAGYEGVYMGPDGIKSVPTYIEASSGAAEGSYVTFGAVGGASGYDEFEAAFTELYDAPVAYAPGSYDSARILLQAAEAVAYVDADGNLVIGRKALADMVRSTPFDGVTGALEFTETGDLSVVSITVYQVVDGDFVEVKTVDFGN
ncbi:MAG: branched-chain amino acid ABC transporter substrate-binding protein [Anaerolineaceae bacterium]|nr:branched-chain amino acid ABC transporter substrate-binding protein [Anaerolineaceae bacterium]